MSIEKIIIAVENNIPLTEICYGTQQTLSPYRNDIKGCFVSNLFNDFKCDYRLKTDFGCFCNYKKNG